MFVWWGDQLINLYNDAYRSILGSKHPKALAQPASVVWHEIWDQVGPRARSAMSTNEGTYDEALLLIMERNGYPEETYYTFSYSPVGGDDGNSVGIFCANSDDTQRIIGERQISLLRELAARTADARTIQDACRLSAEALETNQHDLPFTLIYLFDANHENVTLEGSSGISNLHPATPRSVNLDCPSPWPFAEVLHTNTYRVIGDLSPLGHLPTGHWDRPPTQAIAFPIAPSGQTGRAGVLVAGLNPYRLLDDSYLGFLGLAAGQIAAAIANAQAYEDERKRAESLAELDRAKTAFFSNVSHEFRTPLTLMLGPLEETLDWNGLEPGARQLIDVAHRNGLRLLKLVNSLLDFSRIEAGRVQAIYRPTDLASLTTDLASNFRSAVEKAGLRLIVDCPALEAPVFIDHDMWEKIVLNLISNAFKFTFEGEIRVGLYPSENGSRVELHVSDTGTGVPENELPKLFERFHRVESARGRTHEGTGIGLALVQELVKLHGGDVTVHSTYGKGSEFIVTIPFGHAHLRSDCVGQGPASSSTATRAEAYVQEALRWIPTLSSSADEELLQPNQELAEPDTQPAIKGRILLVDDNADMRDYVRRILSGEHDVVTASNGLEALAITHANAPDLVLSDVMMPGLDGFGLLKALRERPETQTIPLILLSARAGEESRVEGIEAGADDYLVKPFTARELQARVNTHLAISRLRREAGERERRLREEAERSRQELVDILENLSDGFIRLDCNWRFTYVNSAAERLNNMRRQDMLGRSLWDVFEGARATQLEADLRRAMTESVAIHIEHHYPPWNRWFENRVYPDHDGLVIFFQEITDRKLADQALRDTNTALTRANFDLEQFAYSASHDLQEPLRMVVTYSQLLKRRYAGKLDSDAEQIIGYCVEGGVRMDRLIKDLLEYTRASGLSSRVPEPLDLNLALNEARSNLTAALGESGAIVTSTALPSVMMEPVHAAQIFQNLVGNAIKYRSHLSPHVQISAERKGREWIVSVADNGIGIDPQYRDQVFGLFKRLHGSNTYSGTGLGLAICRKLVERYGGRIWVESALGKGSTFRFSLPAED